jgi:hypothetical protein
MKPSSIVNAIGAVLLCSASSFTLAAETALPEAPSNLNVVVMSAGMVSLSWYDNSADERGFYIQRSVDGISWEQIHTLDANAGEYRDAGLNPGTTYMYQVFAYNYDGESLASNRDAAITPTYEELGLSLTLSSLAK